MSEFSLAGVVILSLRLSLFAAREPAPTERGAAVWVGQAWLAIAGLLIVATSVHPGLWLALGVIGCGACGWALRRQVRVA